MHDKRRPEIRITGRATKKLQAIAWSLPSPTTPPGTHGCRRQKCPMEPASRVARAFSGWRKRGPKIRFNQKTARQCSISLSKKTEKELEDPTRLKRKGTPLSHIQKLIRIKILRNRLKDVLDYPRIRPLVHVRDIRPLLVPIVPSDREFTGTLAGPFLDYFERVILTVQNSVIYSFNYELTYNTTFLTFLYPPVQFRNAFTKKSTHSQSGFPDKIPLFLR